MRTHGGARAQFAAWSAPAAGCAGNGVSRRGLGLRHELCVCVRARARARVCERHAIRPRKDVMNCGGAV